MIGRLIDLAKTMREAERRGEELGLSELETAFYDALAENQSAKEAMRSDALRLMARELTEMYPGRDVVPSKDFAFLEEAEGIFFLLKDVDAGLLAADEQSRFEQRDLVATELVDCALVVVNNAPAVLELDAIDVFRFGESFDHVPALGQEVRYGFMSRLSG